jgi:hypothetical protein
MSTINSDEHDAKHGVRSGPEQQARKERSECRGAYYISAIHREKARESL